MRCQQTAAIIYRSTMGLVIYLCLVHGLAPGLLIAQEPIRFAREILPIIQDHCIACHYPGNAKGDISLATFDDLEAAGYVVLGEPDSSYLIELVTSHDGQQASMPKDGPALTEQQVRLLRDWIEQGAQWPADITIHERPKADASWWSLQPLGKPTVPELDSQSRQQYRDWLRTPIDRFVLDELQQADLAPNPLADRSTLLRRLTFDLTGLPPTPEEMAAFLADESPLAYERQVDRLLASPRYGEHWGRHWLDVVRFGESTGYERNIIIDDAWPFRDYVIRSLNADKPFSTLIQEHLAGDVVAADDPQREIGAAFLVNGPYDNVGNQDPVQAAQIRANTIDEMIRASSEAFLGLTFGCARCHDHKFDPIRQTDYYQLYATFAGVEHGSQVWASASERQARAERLGPLQEQKNQLTQQHDALLESIRSRASAHEQEYASRWTRPTVNRTGTQEDFSPVEARFVRLLCDARDDNVAARSGFHIDEFEVWSANLPKRNVALAAKGGVASGPSRSIEDFPGAYGPQLTIDGESGACFIASDNYLMIELATPETIDRVVFSSAKDANKPEQPKFSFPGEYRIEVSLDGKSWTEVASGADRLPVSPDHRQTRLLNLTQTDEEQRKLAELKRSLQAIEVQLRQIPPLPTAWIGKRNAQAAKGPFYVFLGGSPQKTGSEVAPASPAILDTFLEGYRIEDLEQESQRRFAFAQWVTDDQNALTARVLANRLWQYHFGTGIVSTPNDFGYMGEPPSHPELLDYLAGQLLRYGWRLKPIHKLIVMSGAYRQASTFREAAARSDADSRLLWRFPPQRLSAEEIRDCMLSIAGCLRLEMGGPGFRLYRYLQDNVATYVPLDEFSPDTYRRGVYHQNARACKTDLLTEFDQPDCAFSAAKRAITTTPLQALTALNHEFTIDMANAMAERLIAEVGSDAMLQVQRAFLLCFGRLPTQQEE
ncbi:MAG: DUF1553 domain-containing protein, partial [bacterium]|nr:DUF1553 domain-containing protein [bacterium]